MLLLLITLTRILVVVLGATSGGVSSISFTSVVGAPVGIPRARFRHDKKQREKAQ